MAYTNDQLKDMANSHRFTRAELERMDADDVATVVFYLGGFFPNPKAVDINYVLETQSAGVA